MHMADEQTAAKHASANAANGGSCEETIECRALADSSAEECPAKRPKLMDNNSCSAGASMPLLHTPTPPFASLAVDQHLTFVICCSVLQMSQNSYMRFLYIIITLGFK